MELSLSCSQDSCQLSIERLRSNGVGRDAVVYLNYPRRAEDVGCTHPVLPINVYDLDEVIWSRGPLELGPKMKCTFETILIRVLLSQ